jgi:hypothetical protein
LTTTTSTFPTAGVKDQRSGSDGGAPAAAFWRSRPGYLFHPFADFLLAGGASIPCALVVFLLLGDTGALAPRVLAFTSALQLLINYPHFAHSYQMLYAGYGRRVFGPDTDRLTRFRYLWAGIAAPGLMAVFFAFATVQGDATTISYAVNVMVFFVGWHYVKQGYGVLVVLSALRKIYFTAGEKRVLLINAYAVWLCSWLMANAYLAQDRRWGIVATTFDMPDWLVLAGKVGAALTTAAAVSVLFRRVVLARKPVSINGMVGYGCAIYLWLLAAGIDLVFLYMIPAFHSLQYLAFVWRFQLNKSQACGGRRRWVEWLGLRSNLHGPAAFAAFVLLGGVLGWLGFLGLPGLLDFVVPYDPAVWSTALFIFIFTIFINVHHYFIDNVIWRRGNDELRRYLLAA